MGQQYSTVSAIGYNSAPPPDDGSQVAANLITWATHKTKLGDPLHVQIDAINAALVAYTNFSVRQISTSDSTVAGDHMRCVEIAPTVTTAVTVSLGDAATMTNIYRVYIKNSSAINQTVGRVTSGNAIDGATANVTLAPGEGREFQTNNAANGYLTVAGYASVSNVRNYGAVGDGVTDDTTAIQAAINSMTSGVLLFPRGSYKISSTLTIGDGTSAGVSTKNYIAIIGEGAGTAVNEAAPGGATQILWFGAASGTMIQAKGPISSVRIENMILDCRAVASTGLDLIHPFNSVFRNLKTHRATGFAYKITAFTSVSGVAIGANSNLWENVSAENPSTAGSGVQIGASASSPGDLDVAKNTFINCHFISDGATATAYSLELRFVDNCTFIGTTLSRQGGTSSFGIKVSPPTGNTGFPGNILFLNCAVFGITGSGWTGTTRGLTFIPYLTGDGQAVPTQNFTWGITDQGLWFGDLSGQRVAWTPIISGDSTAGTQTYSNQNGVVTKIGNMYFAEFRVTMTAKGGTTAGNIFIAGFPGVPAATGGGGCVTSYSNVDLAAGYSQLSLQNLAGVMYLKQGGDNIAASFVAAAAISATTEIIGTFMYSV